ncbi:MAG: molybdopterin-synthase adenylyltransferase MoeB [Desulfobacterales bacterium]|nr:molybdopterin-synthase adenylyltransferase MoeB [Desulfobacterales bacterium]
MDFTEEQLERYSRHIILADVGVEGQIAIMNSKVLVIGAGGLGSPVALYLAAAGVGRIGIVDADKVDLSNLQRQILHFTTNLHQNKVDSAEEKIRALNPDVQVTKYQEFALASNIGQIMEGYDFVIDGTDNFAAKFLINDACVLKGIPFSHGGVLRFDGQTMTVIPGKTACYRCVFGSPPPQGLVPTCSEAGILGAIAGMLGTIQAAECLKYVTRVGKLLTDSLLIFNAKTMDFKKIHLRRNPRCPICGDHPTITELKDEERPVCDI